MKPGFTIRKLKPSEKKSIQKIANWYFDEWNTPVEKTFRKLTGQPDNDVLFQLVAIKGNDEVIATVCLCNDANLVKVHPRFKNLRPWVGLLYTDKGYRNKGLGTKLLEQVEHNAKEKGLSTIYFVHLHGRIALSKMRLAGDRPGGL